MSAVAMGVRVVSSLRQGAVLVARPRGVVHLHIGPLTRTGASVPSGSRPVCGGRTRRLRVVGGVHDLRALASGRRLCRTCTRLIPSPGSGLVLLDARKAALAHLTVSDLTTAARWARTTDECHQVSTLTHLLYGAVPPRPWTGRRVELAGLHEAIRTRRHGLEIAERTPEEQAEVDARRDAETRDRARIAEARRRADRYGRAADLAAGGHFLMPWEREALATG